MNGEVKSVEMPRINANVDVLVLVLMLWWHQQLLPLSLVASVWTVK